MSADHVPIARTRATTPDEPYDRLAASAQLRRLGE
ncbi:hypothetical protein FHR34_002423 [Kitasatospora kifunensis]|uniref:Uncharacterized protein n=1 Tax=Kitasatospora kifunensis TaxID=58351 RepID=A0A7W7VVF0_KITKI|nr:hypothetical protein [Kitasatospora kifunensis]